MMQTVVALTRAFPRTNGDEKNDGSCRGRGEGGGSGGGNKEEERLGSGNVGWSLYGGWWRRCGGSLFTWPVNK